ncbi:YciI family protein [Paenibacillus sp. LMG 31460]|uniref:YciI family protein n=1 Tax=Paenibacillus germinis TaxID=2654979 RepID=A0ABX1Z0W5_9BACL|nr:YciI family protein [Paenibacillus germinis]NOU86049.1 YciI family protein [Paenibacillus germinis]
MRFMLIIKSTGYSEAGVKISREHNDAMVAYKKSLARAGALLAAEELQPSSSGIRILYPLHGGEPEVKAGPFPVDQELIAGYTLIEVNSEDEAADWALRMPYPRGCGAFEIEMRELKENTDSSRDPRILAMEADLEDQINMLKRI